MNDGTDSALLKATDLHRSYGNGTGRLDALKDVSVRHPARGTRRAAEPNRRTPVRVTNTKGKDFSLSFTGTSSFSSQPERTS